MIYNRLKSAIKRQDWFAVVLEIAIVVVGVVLAFQITAWESNQADLQKERELLKGLYAEFTANLELLDQTFGAHEASIGHAQQMLKWTGPEPIVFKEATIDSLLFLLITETPSYHPAMGEMDAMLGSGQLGLIDDDNIRVAIATWPGFLRRLRETEDMMMSDVMNTFYPYVLERTPLLTIDARVGFIDAPPSRFKRNYGVLLSDLAFENHVENRWIMAQLILDDGKPVRALLVDILRLIRSELGDSDVTLPKTQ